MIEQDAQAQKSHIAMENRLSSFEQPEPGNFKGVEVGNDFPYIGKD